MFDAEELYESDMSFGDYDDDDDDEDDDEDHDDEQDEDDDSKSDDDGETCPMPARLWQTLLRRVGSTSQHARRSYAAHGRERNRYRRDRGRRRISTSDVDALGHDDIAILTQYISQNHPRSFRLLPTDIPRHKISSAALTGGDADDIGWLHQEALLNGQDGNSGTQMKRRLSRALPHVEGAFNL